jgi:hypothetical protein
MTNRYRCVWALSALLCGCAGAGGRPNWWKSRGNLASAALGQDGATGVEDWHEKIGVELGCPVLWSDGNHREYTDSRILVGMRGGARAFLPQQGNGIGGSIVTSGLIRYSAVSVGEAFPNTAYVTSIGDGSVVAQGVSEFGLSLGPSPTNAVPGVWRTPTFGGASITAPTPWSQFVFVGIGQSLFALNRSNGKWAVSDGGWSTWLGDEVVMNSSPVVVLGATSDDDTVVIVVTIHGTVFKLNPNDGSILMKRQLISRRTPDQSLVVPSSWALSSDSRTLYLAGADASIHAIDVATLDESWRYDTHASARELPGKVDLSAPAVGFSGGSDVIYFWDIKGGVSVMHAVNAATHQEMWNKTLPGRASSDPVVTTASHTVYVGIRGRNPDERDGVVAIDGSDSPQKWFVETEAPVECLALAENGAIYATTSTELIAIR